MPSEKEVYEKHTIEYELLIAYEDYKGNILRSVKEIIGLRGLDVIDLGSGTGRLACLRGVRERRRHQQGRCQKGKSDDGELPHDTGPPG